MLFCAVLLLLLCALFQSGQQWLHTTMASRRIKIDRHFDDLEEVYFSSRRLTADTALASASTQVYLGFSSWFSSSIGFICSYDVDELFFLV